METSKNYVGYDMVLTDDVQIVRGVAGNALYFPFGHGHIQEDNNYNDVSFSLWRRWDGVADDDYRGILKTANVKIYFDNVTDKLKIELEGLEPVTVDVIDEASDQFNHWAFTFCKGDVFTAYKNEEPVWRMPIGDFVVDLKSEGLQIGGGKSHASFDEIRTDKCVYTMPNIRALHRLISRGVQASDVQEMVSESAPKYLGTVKTVPTTRTVVITKGERTGAVDANTGDWVLMTEEAGGWKQGVCYKWAGTKWVALQPEVNYTEEYHACLLHLFEIPELAEKTGHFGALFAKVFVAQKALIDNLIVKNVLVDKDINDPTNFQLSINEIVGLLIKNYNETLFEVKPDGNARFYGISFQREGSFLKERFEIPDHDMIPTIDEEFWYEGKEVESVRISTWEEEMSVNVHIRSEWYDDPDYWGPGFPPRIEVLFLKKYDYTKTYKKSTIRLENGKLIEDTIEKLEITKIDNEFKVDTGETNAPPYTKNPDTPHDFKTFNLKKIKVVLKNVKYKNLLTIDNIPDKSDVTPSSLPKGTLYKDGDFIKIV